MWGERAVFPPRARGTLRVSRPGAQGQTGEAPPTPCRRSENLVGVPRGVSGGNRAGPAGHRGPSRAGGGFPEGVAFSQSLVRFWSQM